ncbi:hypothetical protein LWI29_024575 [Acer saccharum]|uniref:Uncharacterized protein n=1 Tax=Acer saccharum TaxID=4024 RepID=A0AA39S9U2_ACESA|nr:hypothetical protein LWI29_024575 [Acer saccharum]
MSTAMRNREEFVTCRLVRDRKSFAARVWVSLVKRHFSWFVVDVGSHHISHHVHWSGTQSPTRLLPFLFQQFNQKEKRRETKDQHHRPSEPEEEAQLKVSLMLSNALEFERMC